MTRVGEGQSKGLSRVVEGEFLHCVSARINCSPFLFFFQALSSLCRLQSPPPTNSSVSRQFGHAVRVLKGCTHTRTPCCTRKKTCIPPVVWISSCALICDDGKATCVLVLVERSLPLEESGFAADIHLRLCPSPEDTCTHTHI